MRATGALASVRLSASTIEQYRTCPRKAYFAQVHGLDSDTPDFADTAKAHAKLSRAVCDVRAVHARVLFFAGAKEHPAIQRGVRFVDLDLEALRSMTAALRGTLVHAALEMHYSGDDLQPGVNPVHAIAFEALPYLPPRGPGIVLEREFSLTITRNVFAEVGRGDEWTEDVTLQGRKDLESEYQGMAWGKLWDHKTTRDLQYSKVVCANQTSDTCEMLPQVGDALDKAVAAIGGPKRLQNGEEDDAYRKRIRAKCLSHSDLQSALYSLEAMRTKTGMSSHPYRWNYLKTKWSDNVPVTECTPRDGVIVSRNAHNTVLDAVPVALALKRLPLYTHHSQVPIDPRGCKAFGGCKFQGICNLTPDERLDAIMQQQNFPYQNQAPAPQATNGAPVPPGYPTMPPPPPDPMIPAILPPGSIAHPQAPGWWILPGSRLLANATGATYDPATQQTGQLPMLAPPAGPPPVVQAAPAPQPPADAPPQPEPGKKGPGRPKGSKSKTKQADAPPPPQLGQLPPVQGSVVPTTYGNGTATPTVTESEPDPGLDLNTADPDLNDAEDEVDETTPAEAAQLAGGAAVSGAITTKSKRQAQAYRKIAEGYFELAKALDEK